MRRYSLSPLSFVVPRPPPLAFRPVRFNTSCRRSFARTRYSHRRRERERERTREKEIERERRVTPLAAIPSSDFPASYEGSGYVSLVRHPTESISLFSPFIPHPVRASYEKVAPRGRRRKRLTDSLPFPSPRWSGSRDRVRREINFKSVFSLVASLFRADRCP